MTKHPSRKVMNFRHLLSCDTIDEAKNNEQMEMIEKQSKGQNNDKIAGNETSKRNKCKPKKQNLFAFPHCSRDSMVKLFYKGCL